MLFHFKELAAQDRSVVFHEALNIGPLIKDRRDILEAEPLNVDLSAQYEGGIVKVRGEISSQLVMSCSRCLSPVKETVLLPINEEFRLVTKEEAIKLSADEEINSVTDEKVDLTPYVEETFVMYLPFAPLCDEACKGLCPTCGNNRNEQQCGCDQEKLDPRLAGLKDFFKQ